MGDLIWMILLVALLIWAGPLRSNYTASPLHAAFTLTAAGSSGEKL
jgi:hypothetical protein